MAYVEYERWNGAGDLLNIVDNRSGRYDQFFNDVETKRKMVAATGANGIMEIRRAPVGQEEDVAYNLRFHTGLGECGPVPVCGNGSRCTAAYACTHNILPPAKHSNFKFLAADGIHDASCQVDYKSGKHFVRISMMDIKNVTEVSNGEWFANSGSAHLVKFVPIGSSKDIDVVTEGERLSEERSYLAPDLMILVNFVEDREDGVFCRCYDPPSKREILACGTASASIAVCHASYKKEPEGSHLKLIGWAQEKISVGYNKDGDYYSNITLESEVNCQVKGKYMLT